MRFEPAGRQTPALARYQQLGLGMRFDAGIGPNSEVRHYEIDQWMKLLNGAGVRYVALIVKPNSGWCFWDSRFTDYDIASSKNKPGLVREFLAACRRHRIATGFSFCLAKDADGHHGPKMTDEAYYEFANNQLRELLTGFGRIDVLWMEAARPPDRMQQAYNTIKSIQPECVVISHGGNYNPRRLQNVADVYQPSDEVPPPNDSPWRQYRGKRYYIPWETFILFRGGEGEPVSPPPGVCAALLHEIRKRDANAMILWYAGPLRQETFGRYFDQVNRRRGRLAAADRLRKSRTAAARKGEFIQVTGPMVHDYTTRNRKYVYHWTRNQSQRRIATRYAAIRAAEMALMERLRTETVPGGRPVAEVLMSRPQLKQRLEREIEAADIVQTQWDDRGGCAVTLRVYKRWIEQVLTSERNEP